MNAEFGACVAGLGVKPPPWRLLVADVCVWLRRDRGGEVSEPSGEQHESGLSDRVVHQLGEAGAG